MNVGAKAWLLVIFAIFAVLLITVVVLSRHLLMFFEVNLPLERPEWIKLVPCIITIKAILVSVNSILLTIVLAIYLGIYRKTGSDFSVGLIVFSTALLSTRLLLIL